MKNSDSDTIIEGFKRILKIVKWLNLQEKPNKCELGNVQIYPTLDYNKSLNNESFYSEFYELFNNKPFDVFELFNKPNNLLESLIYNIYFFLKQNKCPNIIGIERSGIPLASLVAYEFNLPLHILRTVPQVKLLPSKVATDEALLLDDIAITGTNFIIAKNYLSKEIKLKKIKTLVVAKENIANNVDEYFFGKNDNKYEIYTRIKNFDPINIEASKNYDIKNELKNYCTNKGFWYSEYAYNKRIFRSVCNEFIKRIEANQIQSNCLIISTSIFGLPFASVVSHKLKRPLYLFSRRPNPNLSLSFNQEKSLKENLNKGYTSIAFIDDVYSSGTTSKLAEEKLKNMSNKIDIHRFVMAYLGNEEEYKKLNNFECILTKTELNN